MSKIPAAFIEELRARLPVSQVVGTRVTLKKAGREWKGLSPFNKEKTASFFVNDAKQFWFDFSSGRNGSIIDFVMLTDGLPFRDAVTYLADMAGMKVPADSPEAEAASLRRASMRELVAAAAQFYRRKLTGPEGARARGYLADRGIDPATAELFALGYAPHDGVSLKAHLLGEGADLEDLAEAGLVAVPEGATTFRDRFADRLMFPIGDVRDRVVGFGGRALGDWKPKYLNSPECAVFHKGQLLYNAASARAAAYAGKPLRVVEGYIDAIAMVSAGHPATVATLGTAVTDEQLRLLWSWSAEPTLCFDGDGAGARAADRVIDLALPGLGDGRSVRFATMPLDADPDTILRADGPEGLQAILDQSVPLADALWRRESEATPCDTPEQCSALQDRLRTAVGLIKDKGVRAAYGRHLSGALYAFFKGRPVPGFRPAGASKFGRLRWADQDQPGAVEYAWQIKGLLPKRETIGVFGETQTGKSYETFNMLMHVARGVDYRGCKTEQGLVVYCAPEGGRGFRDRMRAYRKHHALDLDAIPFEVLTSRFDLYGSDTDINDLILEIRAIVEEYDTPLAYVAIDTYSAATPGIKENHSEDISRVRQRIVRLQRELVCGVVIVDHTNAAGTRVRGHSSKTADIETAFEVVWVTEKQGKDAVRVKDENGRYVRRLTLTKQREGDIGQHWDFVLPAIEVRIDADGEPVTACVSTDPQRATPEREQRRQGPTPTRPGEGFKLNSGEAEFFKALLKAVDMHGFQPPADVGSPPGVHRVVRWSDMSQVYKAEQPMDEGADDKGRAQYAWRVKAALRRARTALKQYAVIGIGQTGGADGHHVLWATGKRVYGPDLQWPPRLRAVSTNESAKSDDGDQGSLEDMLARDDEVPPP